MLWIISVSSTVLPTPAPPKSPALPPRSSGTSTSMTLMPVSKISDLVERRASGGGARCTERHWTSDNAASRSMALPNTSNIRERIAFAHRRLQRPARVLHRHAASETLRGRQRNPAHVMRIALRQHFDDDSPFRSRAQHRVDRRQMLIEPYIHDAAAHRDDRAEIRRAVCAHVRSRSPCQSIRHRVCAARSHCAFPDSTSSCESPAGPAPCLSMYCLCSISLSLSCCFR